MARLTDIPAAVREVGVWGLLQRIYRETSEDQLVMWAAALAYSWLFAIFPFLVFLMSLLPYLPESTKEAAKNEILIWVYDSMPWQAAETVWENVKDILARPRTALLSVGIVLTLWAASGGINTTITALDKCYDLPEGRPFYRQRPLAIMLTLVVAGLILLLVLVLPVGTIAINWLEANSYAIIHRPVVLFWRIARYPVALALMFAVLHVIYHYGPSIRQPRVYLSPGAVFCVAVWMGLGLVFRFYMDHYARYNQTYGTVSGAAILLLFFYLDSLVLLIGAEINSEIDFIVRRVPRGSRDFTGIAPRPEAAGAALGLDAPPAGLSASGSVSAVEASKTGPPQP
jgi:membrane protein